MKISKVKTNISEDVSVDTKSNIDEVSEATGMTKGAVIDSAVSVYIFVKNLLDKQNKIIILDKKGKARELKIKTSFMDGLNDLEGNKETSDGE